MPTSFCLSYTLPLHSSTVKSFALWLLTVTLSSLLAKPAQLPYLGCNWQHKKQNGSFTFFYKSRFLLTPPVPQTNPMNCSQGTNFLRAKQPPRSHKQNSVISFLLTTENYMKTLWFCLNLLPSQLQLSALPVLFSLMVVIKIDKWA